MSEPAAGERTSKDYGVSIRSGRHAGAAVRLAAGRYALGSAADADILLSDAGIAPTHVEVDLRDGVCRLRAVDGAVLVDGRSLATGVRAELRLPSEFSLGGVRIAVSSELSAAPSPVRLGRRRVRLMAGAVGALAVMGVIGGIVLDGMPAASRGFPETKRPIGVADFGHAGLSAAGAVAAVEPAVEVTPEDERPVAVAAGALGRRLRSAGLTGLVSVRVAGSTIEAWGSVRPENERDWLSVQAWFDETYRGRMPLLARVKVDEGAAAVPRFAIRGIWTGADAYVIASDGEKYGVGSKLPGGWAIERIEREQIVVSRQGDRVSLVP
jgi:hypothetical protein